MRVWRELTRRWTGLQVVTAEYAESAERASVNGIHSSSEGRKSYPPLMMVRVMLLQQWYGASDPAMEEALSDRLSFRRFVGLGIQDESPDHSTISRFRRQSHFDESKKRSAMMWSFSVSVGWPHGQLNRQPC